MSEKTTQITHGWVSEEDYKDHKPLTPKMVDQALELGVLVDTVLSARRRGLTIKDIASELPISEKRVEAILKGDYA